MINPYLVKSYCLKPMFISQKEFDAMMARLANIEKAERQGCKKNYISYQVGQIRLMLKKAYRREKNTLL